MESATDPVLVKVTACAALVVPTTWPANVRLAGDKVIVGVAAPVATPVNETCCGLDAALSTNEIAPARVPPTVGVKVTETKQLALAARLDPQLFVCAKSPEAAMLLIESAADEVLVTVTDCAALVVLTT